MTVYNNHTRAKWFDLGTFSSSSNVLIDIDLWKQQSQHHRYDCKIYVTHSIHPITLIHR